jgi:GntR family transcriptional repressor for pyruvate dehydrogenase complex
MENAPNYSNYGRWDAAFHQAVANAAHNKLLLSLFASVNAVRNQEAWSRLWQSALTSSLRERYRAEHAAIVRTVVERNPHKSERAMRAHLETVESSLKGTHVFTGDNRIARRTGTKV